MGDCKGEALMNRISALIKQTLQSSLPFSPTLVHSEKMAVYEPGGRVLPDTKSVDILNLGFPTSKNVRNKCYLSHPVYNNFDICA